ncbi:hypothetical protein F2Q70_00031329 [Brassica cretica]|uniref:Leucine-rich repeat-containing N-terminal plant-type domain-containing protein n=1 Tax=Brassica cretica TaxID=69181 RepID=A0A8S9FDT9_BRACR|nr:hypothetical protein F2Q70_00031329 [Brassica cretica]
MDSSRQELQFDMWLVVWFLGFSFFADAMLDPVDFLSLQEIRKSLHDLPGSNFFHSWDFNSDPRGFAGVYCDGDKILASLGEVRRLRTLDLSYNQLTGTISPSIGYLPELSNLILCHNHLTGSIPPFLSQSLTRIDLKRNSLTGSISPASLPPSLRYLSLAWNQLTGPVDRVLLQLNQVNYLSDISDTVWDLSSVPSPEGGFDLVSHFSNFHFLQKMMKEDKVPLRISQVIPWVIWFLRKFRNGILFEDRRFTAPEIVGNMYEEAEVWFMAQVAEKNRVEKLRAESQEKKVWEAPQNGLVKCNVCVDWNREEKMGGTAWVVKNLKGKVMMHSRRAFFNTGTMEDKSSVGMTVRPKAWPNFRFEALKILKFLSKIEWWGIGGEERCTNRGDFLIAQSVTKGRRYHSYVTQGSPSWLHVLFESEEIRSSV